MPTIRTGATLNPNAYNFLLILEVFKGSYTATLNTAQTEATFTVSGATYKVVGTGLALTNGKLSAGTITALQKNVGSFGEFQLTELSLSVSALNAAATAEATNPLALENLLSGQDWTIFTSTGANTATPGSVALTGKNTWNLGDGNDTATGGSGIDKMYGGNGNDTLSGGLGNDTLTGDAGDDILNGNDGLDMLYGGAGLDVLNGLAGADKLYGGGEDALVNTLNGGDGNDLLVDGDGAGVLSGGNDNDKLYGGKGNDTLGADAGNDSLFGDAGTDILTGGAGADKFIFRSSKDLGATTATADSITDFVSGTDKINLAFWDLTFIGTKSFTSGSSEPEVRWDAVNTRLVIDADGNNSIDYYIDLQAGATLVAKDLIL